MGIIVTATMSTRRTWATSSSPPAPASISIGSGASHSPSSSESGTNSGPASLGSPCLRGVIGYIARYWGPLPPSRGVQRGPRTSVALQSTQLGGLTRSSSPTRSYTPAGQRCA